MTMNEGPKTPLPYPNWLSHAWQFLSQPHPSIQKIGQRRRAQLSAMISLILTGLFLMALLFRPSSYSPFLVLLIITGISFALSRTRYYRAGSYFFSYGVTSLAYISLVLGTASSFEAAITTYAHTAIIGASIILSLREFMVLVILASIATFAAPVYSNVPISYQDADFFRIAGTFAAIGFILVGANIFRSRVEKERMQASEDLNRQLTDIKANLEKRVEDRTAELDEANRQTSRRALQLQTITELSESIAQLKDLNEIFPAVTRLISERFGFYHVGVFLVDRDREFAILQAANSDGGKRMLERSHRLRLGTGVVGFAAQTGQPRIALDVGTDSVFFDNPDLPETRSEVALPLKSRGLTIGVLDVQSTWAGAFSNEDLQVLTALANQVSIALENARLLTEARAALVQVQEVYNEFTRAEWSRIVSRAERRGFRYQAGHTQILEKTLKSNEVASAVKSGNVVTSQSNGSEEKRASVAVPVKLRGEVIGVLHIESNDPHKNWHEDEISLVQAVAERAAFAMENARLFQDARRRAAKERLISEATAHISSALSIENILHTTAEELERALGGSEILIKFQSKEQS
ncbi:MAG TPA: GAF domain-containing protein [Anaerolineales bacterium]|nr:GAF domain-containing protein [Anaerolineales bacterium]